MILKKVRNDQDLVQGRVINLLDNQGKYIQCQANMWRKQDVIPRKYHIDQIYIKCKFVLESTRLDVEPTLQYNKEWKISTKRPIEHRAQARECIIMPVSRF